MQAAGARCGSLATVEAGLAEFRAGRCLVVVDDEARENEGDLIVPADAVTPATINFMATHARGLICVAMTGERLDQLGVPMMLPPERNTSAHATPFTVSVEARQGVSTGISAADRARTVHVLIDPASSAADLAMPGHMFPLRARDGGVLARAGHTEAAVDLCRLAGRVQAGVLCEIMNADGTMARLPNLRRFAQRHSLKVVAINDLITYRMEHEPVVERVSAARLPTKYGDFCLIAYRSRLNADEHIALVLGDLGDGAPVLARLHEQCLIGDAFGSLACDCHEQAARALARIGRAGRGVFLYLRQEGRGATLHAQTGVAAIVGLSQTVSVGARPQRNLDATPDYAVGRQMLADLGMRAVRLLSSDPADAAGLAGGNLTVVEQLAIGADRTSAEPAESSAGGIRSLGL